MPRVRVRIPAALRAYAAGGASQLDVEAATLRDALRQLGDATPRVLDDAGRVRRHIHVFVNGAQQPSLEVPLAEGDVVHVLPAVSGGSTSCL